MMARNSITVNGGIYEGYGHGGIYFTVPNSTSYINTSYIKDAIIREGKMPDGYVTDEVSANYAGMYIGGNDNITVYMDNCSIYGGKSPIVLRGTDGEQNNSLYISNSIINTDSIRGLRIDNDTHKLYLGSGNNFDANNTTLPSSVIVTDEVYLQD